MGDAVKVWGEKYRSGRTESLARFIEDGALKALDYDETLAFYRKVGPTLTREGQALLGCNDRFYLLAGILGRRDVVHPWLFGRCREVEADPDDHLDLWAREHYKSTIITYAGIQQELARDGDMTIGVFSFTASIARGFVKQARLDHESNELFRHVFADIMWDRPKKQSPMWSNVGFVVRRASNPKEPSVEGWGLVTALPTGRHFRLRLYDDAVNERSVTNAEQTRKANEAYQLSDNLGGGENRKQFVGTRYSFADMYGWMMGQDKPMVTPRIYPATHNGKADGRPVFFTEEKWASKLKNQLTTINAQMLQNPLGGAARMFEPKWFKGFFARPGTLNVYIMVDPSKGRGATSDRTAIAVIGLDGDGNRFLLDGYCHRMPMSERWVRTRDLRRKWMRARGVQFVDVGLERYGLQMDDEYWREQMARDKDSFPFRELNWTAQGVGNQGKTMRVERLEPHFRLSKFYMPAIVYAPSNHTFATPEAKAKAESELGEWGLTTRHAVWGWDSDTDKIVVGGLKGVPRELRRLERQNHEWRFQKPIVARDETGKLYDVTRHLMDELSFFPFAPHDDFVDAVSRSEDMEMVAPSISENAEAVERLLNRERYADA